ncbi:MAG: amidohydrolase family protein [Armatimonadota bacterium]|nr:amidohydrolase family protein [Armatimonadota bacterium]
MIDTHTHIHYDGRIPGERVGIGPDQLVDSMNRNGIDMSVVLPIESPEVVTSICMTETVIEAALRYPERLIPFVHVDPRMPRAETVIRHFAATCSLVRGFGELVDGLPIDHERHKLIYATCSDLGLPVIFYGSSYSNFDDTDFSGLESCLREFPDLIFIGHGPRWWNGISADDDGSCGYPDTPVVEGGSADRLLQDYDNMYADISAGSGYNAMTRDPDFTQGFIERNWRKIMFATDYLYVGQELGQLEWIRETPMAQEHRQAIAEGNARRVLSLDED